MTKFENIKIGEKRIFFTKFLERIDSSPDSVEAALLTQSLIRQFLTTQLDLM